MGIPPPYSSGTHFHIGSMEVNTIDSNKTAFTTYKEPGKPFWFSIDLTEDQTVLIHCTFKASVFNQKKIRFLKI